MSNSSSAIKTKFSNMWERIKSFFKNFKLTKNWIIAIVVVACIGAAIGGCFIGKAVAKNPGVRVFENYLSAAKSQNVDNLAKTMFKKGSTDYNEFVSDFKAGKSQYKSNTKGMSEDEYNAYLMQPEILEGEVKTDLGLALTWEQKLAKNIKGFDYKIVRSDKDQIVIDFTLELKQAYSTDKLPGKYSKYGNVSNSFTLKFKKDSGKWYFADDFRIIAGQGIEDTWKASYSGGKELKRLNPNDSRISAEGILDLRNIGEDGDNIVSIGMYALEGCEKIKQLIIPDGLKNISAYAFKDCKNLTTIKYASGEIVADSNITIGEGAFFRCEKLEKFVFPSVNKIVPNYAFAGCAALTTFSMGDVESIGYYAFYGCTGLKSVVIPSSVTVISNGAFENCIELANIAADHKLPVGLIRMGANSFKGCIKLTSVILPEGLRDISRGVFEGCTGLVNIGSFADGLESIGAYAFSGTALTSAALPATVRKIGNNAFAGSKIASLEFGTFANGETGIRTIGERAFYECDKLTYLDLPKTIQGIGTEAFIGCTSMRSVMVNFSKNATIGDKIFEMSQGIPKVYIKNDLAAFKTNWNIMGLDMYSQSIIQGDFAIIEETRKVDTVNTVTDTVLIQYLGNDKNLTIDENIVGRITKIGDGAFSYFAELETITNFAQLDLREIGRDVFAGCTKMRFDRFGTSNKGHLNYLGEWLISTTNLTPARIDLSNPDAYEFVSGNPGNIADTTLTKGIAAGAFTDADGISGIKFGAELLYIGDSAFEQREDMTTVSFADGSKLERIGAKAFYNCALLDGVDLPESLRFIGDQAFEHCNNLRFVIINSDESVLLGRNVFVVIDNVLRIYINDYATNEYYTTNANWTVSEIAGAIIDTGVIKDSDSGAYAFDNTTKTFIQYLGTDTDFRFMPEDTKIIGVAAFAKAPVQTVTIPSSVQRVERLAFYSCLQLTNVTFMADGTAKDSLVYLGDYVFRDTEAMNNDKNAKVVFQASKPNAELVMGTDPFDTGMYRKVEVAVRANYVGIKNVGGNTYWKANAEYLNAEDDPVITIDYLLVDGDLNDITDQITDNHSNDVSEGGSSAPETEIVLEATLDTANGYVFAGWFVGETFKSDKLAYTTNYGVAEEDVTYTAKFIRKQVKILIDGDANDQGGIIKVGESAVLIGSSKLVDVDGTYTLTVETKVEYNFLGWYVDGVRQHDNATFDVTVGVNNETVEVRFEKARDWVVIKYNPNQGDISIEGTVVESDVTVAGVIKLLVTRGEVIDVTATAKTGFTFKQWKIGSLTSTDATRTVTMGANSIELEAVFETTPTNP